MSGGEDDYLRRQLPNGTQVPGRSVSSYGLQCARKAGIAETVISRARDVTAMLQVGDKVTPLATTANSTCNDAMVGSKKAVNASVEVASALLRCEDWGAASDVQLAEMLSLLAREIAVQ